MIRIIERLRNKGLIHKKKNQGKYYGVWINLDIPEIVLRYKALLNGLVNYYRLADNSNKFGSISYFLKFSCAHTLAGKLKVSIASVFKKYGKYITVQYGKKSFNLDFKKNLKITNDVSEKEVYDILNWNIRTNFSMDLPCKICGIFENIEMHHIRHLKDLNPKLSGIHAMMAKMKRKQIPLCKTCHDNVHSGKYSGPKLK